MEGTIVGGRGARQGATALVILANGEVGGWRSGVEGKSLREDEMAGGWEKKKEAGKKRLKGST